MRTLAQFAILSFTLSAQAGTITFVSPLAGAQVIGPTALEIATETNGVDRVDFFVDGVLAGVARKPPYRIAFDFGTSQNPRTVTAKVWTAGFTSSATASVTTAGLTVNDNLDVHLVEVPLRVLSARPLKTSDLRVRENGVEQSVRTVQRERPAAHFAFVVDRSLSMNEGKLAAALAAIESELRQLRPGDTASLVLFDHRVSKAVPVAPGDALQRLATNPSGGTSLRDAVASVASPSERRYAIVITDGGDRSSDLTEEEALRKISGAKTMVHAIVLGSSHARFLDRATSNTGGTVVHASRSSLRNELSGLLADINSRYLIVYQSKGAAKGWRTVDVKGRQAQTRIAAQKRYFAE